MKDMKLYDRAYRILNELRALGIADEDRLDARQLSAFDQYHYFGTAAVDEAIAALGLTAGSTVLDIGSGLGGPARHMALAGAEVTALELQADLDELAASLTARCGLTHKVHHACGNVLDGVALGPFDNLVSMLCFLHIPDRPRLFSVCRTALKPGGGIYIEDYALRRPLTPQEAETLRTKVQCPYLPDVGTYESDLRGAGFTAVSLRDVTAEWTSFTADRLAGFRGARARQIAVHGEETVANLEDFYAAVAGLFAAGAITGVKILAR